MAGPRLFFQAEVQAGNIGGKNNMIKTRRCVFFGNGDCVWDYGL